MTQPAWPNMFQPVHYDLEGLGLNRIVVFGFGLVYWTGVWIQARRVRRRIGRSPNVRPRGSKEKLLWGGWFLVVAAWLALPALLEIPPDSTAYGWAKRAGLGLGAFLMVAGYAGTLWCYAAMGNAWRMGISEKEETRLVTSGPYRFVRHPIYLCQVVMVAAIAVLLPSVLSLAVMAFHLCCVRLKAAEEESYLRTFLGRPYDAYCAQTGVWFPKFSGAKSAAASTADAQQNPLNTTGQHSR